MFLVHYSLRNNLPPPPRLPPPLLVCVCASGTYNNDYLLTYLCFANALLNMTTIKLLHTRICMHTQLLFDQPVFLWSATGRRWEISGFHLSQCPSICVTTLKTPVLDRCKTHEKQAARVNQCKPASVPHTTPRSSSSLHHSDI